MKYIITAIALATIALTINIKISSDIKWQEATEQEWENLLDPNYTPIEVLKLYKAHQWCAYVFGMAKQVKE